MGPLQDLDKLMPLGISKKGKNNQGFPNFLDYRILFKEHLAKWMFQWLYFGEHQILGLKIFMK